MGERRSFSQELKKKAVQRMQQGCNVAALARELGVRRKLLYEWRDRIAGGPFPKVALRSLERRLPRRRPRRTGSRWPEPWRWRTVF